MNRLISALCATVLATFVVGCETDLPSSPTTGAAASPHVTISKSSVVCNIGCTSNNNGMGPGGDTVWMAIGSIATIQPLSGTNLIIRSVPIGDSKMGIWETKIDSTHLRLSSTDQVCSYPGTPTPCVRRVTYAASPPPPYTKATYGDTTVETIVVVLSKQAAPPIDSAWVPLGGTTTVDLSQVTNMVARSVTYGDPKAGIVAREIDSTHVAISSTTSTCPNLSCTLRVTYVAAPPNQAFADTATGTIVVTMLEPPAIQNVTIPVGYTGPFAPVLISASQFATGGYGTALSVTAATAQVSVPGLAVSVVNGELTVMRLLPFIGSGSSVPVQVTVSDGRTWATGTITLQLQ